MANDEAFRIGALLADLRASLERGQSYQQARDRIAQGGFTERLRELLYALAFGLYVRGASFGYILQGQVLGGVSGVPRNRLDAWRDEADQYGQTVRGSMERLSEGDKILTPAAGLAWLDAATDQGLRQGTDRGQLGAARDLDAAWKTWVRIAPVREMRAHSFLSGTTIPIDSKFSLLDGRRCDRPRDWASVPDPAEWIHCGHSVVYSRQARARDLEQALTPRPFSPARIERGIIRRR